MPTLQKVVMIGHLFPIAEDPDFRQEANLIRLMTKTEKGVRKAWKEACRRYGYSDREVRPMQKGAPKQAPAPSVLFRDFSAFRRRSLFKASTYRRPKFWKSLEEILLPDEQRTLWKWAQCREEKITPAVQAVIDTVIFMTAPL